MLLYPVFDMKQKNRLDYLLVPNLFVIIVTTTEKLFWVARIFSVDIYCNIDTICILEMLINKTLQNGITLVEQFGIVRNLAVSV
jgi:hypothetical protein